MTPHGPEQVSPWIARFAPRVPPGPVLDIAAGRGRHSRFFRDRGHPVIAIDRDPSALAASDSPPVMTIVTFDLEADAVWPLGAQTFSAVVVTNYLHRPLFPTLLLSVAPGGLLLYETFAVGHEQFGRPRNPDHLLRVGELLEVVRGTLDVVAYEHGPIEDPSPAVVQRIAARRSA